MTKMARMAQTTKLVRSLKWRRPPKWQNGQIDRIGRHGQNGKEFQKNQNGRINQIGQNV